MTEFDASAFELLPVGVALVARDHRILSANRCLLQMLGGPNDVIVGHPIDDLVPHAALGIALDELVSGVRDDVSIDASLKRGAKPELGVRVLLSRAAAKTNSADVACVAVVVRDEERRVAERALRGSLSLQQATFDAAADGFVRSEGCAVVLLKRLSDAERDGDRILAVVRGTAANSDGRTRNIATPSVDAQVAALRAALDVSGVEAHTIGAVEAHGTGTPVGDPIEFTSLATEYGTTGTVLLGSAKSNFGHAEAAAGVAGLLKAVLMLERKAVPASLHFERLNPHVELGGVDLRVPTALTPLAPRAVGVSSFGFSGTNAHLVLTPAPAVPLVSG